MGASLKETHRTYPLCDQTLCPTCKEEGHASILHTILCNYAILATQRGGTRHNAPPPKYAPGLHLVLRNYFDDIFTATYKKRIRPKISSKIVNLKLKFDRKARPDLPICCLTQTLNGCSFASVFKSYFILATLW